METHDDVVMVLMMTAPGTETCEEVTYSVETVELFSSSARKRRGKKGAYVDSE